MNRTITIFAIVLLGISGAFAGDPPALDPAASTEARLRKQVEELTVMVKKLREVAQGLNTHLAALEDRREENATAIDILLEADPRTAHVLLEVARIEMDVDRREDVANLIKSNDGSASATENIRRLRMRYLSAIDAWVKGKEHLRNALPNAGQKSQ